MTKFLSLISIVVTSVGPVVAATNNVYAQSEGETNTVTHTMNKTVDPQVYANLMQQMFTNPTGFMTNPNATCSQCHTDEDMQRISKTMGPMMQMMNPGNWMNPNAYMQMMVPMMDPETYTNWYDAWMKKFGGATIGLGGDTGKPNNAQQ